MRPKMVRDTRVRGVLDTELTITPFRKADPRLAVKSIDAALGILYTFEHPLEKLKVFRRNNRASFAQFVCSFLDIWLLNRSKISCDRS